MSIQRLHVLIAAVERILLMNENHGGYCPKRYTNTYGRTVETTAKQCNRDNRESVKVWSCKKVTIEEHGLGSEKEGWR